MSKSGSLRWSLVLGAVLWTLGLFTVAGVVLTYLIQTHPHAPILFHFPFTHVGMATFVAVVLLVAGLAQVRRGVSPIAKLRDRLAAVHQGNADRVDGSFPSEVAPLVDDLNNLLAHHEVAINRAQRKAGDLAHGLKTPLAVLAHEAATAEEHGHTDLAASIRQQVDRMRRQIDYHLAHARAAASGATMSARSSVADSVDGLVRTVGRIHAERNLDIHTTGTEGVTARVQREDLDEMLGNLLDNACKWASRRIDVAVTATDTLLTIIVDDDGPGVPPGRRYDVLQRGVRADELAPGSGFGLAIVRELAELYGGSIRLDASPLGGARAVLTLPAAG
jgi:signal transduction histidine kinase